MASCLKEGTKCGLEKLKEPDMQGGLLMLSIIMFILSCGIPTKGKMYKYLTRRIIIRMNRNEMDYCAVKKKKKGYKRNLERNTKIICYESGAEKPGHNHNFCAAHYPSHASSHRALQLKSRRFF